jgi:hypothetical protein
VGSGLSLRIRNYGKSNSGNLRLTQAIANDSTERCM